MKRLWRGWYWRIVQYISLHGNKLLWCSFMEVSRRQETTGSETEDSFIHSTAESRNCMFISTPLALQIPWGSAEAGQLDAAYTVGLCYSWETLSYERPNLLNVATSKLAQPLPWRRTSKKFALCPGDTHYISRVSLLYKSMQGSSGIEDMQKCESPVEN